MFISPNYVQGNKSGLHLCDVLRGPGSIYNTSKKGKHEFKALGPWHGLDGKSACSASSAAWFPCVWSTQRGCRDSSTELSSDPRSAMACIHIMHACLHKVKIHHSVLPSVVVLTFNPSRDKHMSEFKVILVSIVSFRLCRAAWWDPVSQTRLTWYS